MHTGHASVQYHAAHVCTSLLSKHCWSALNPHLQAAALSLSLSCCQPLCHVVWNGKPTTIANFRSTRGV